jgi:hypothetical protein
VRCGVAPQSLDLVVAPGLIGVDLATVCELAAKVEPETCSHHHDQHEFDEFWA